MLVNEFDAHLTTLVTKVFNWISYAKTTDAEYIPEKFEPKDKRTDLFTLWKWTIDQVKEPIKLNNANYVKLLSLFHKNTQKVIELLQTNKAKDYSEFLDSVAHV